MHIHLISLFPDIFTSFREISLIAKATHKEQINFSFYNPRDFCKEKQQVDDTPYGGGAGMLIKAEPIIASIETCLASIGKDSYHIIVPAPSHTYFQQTDALAWSSIDHLVFVCGRYEGIDHRVDLWLNHQHPEHRSKMSLGKFILLGGEIASMTMIESIVRLIPGVIKEVGSRQHESYDPLAGLSKLEAPQYTRPQEVRGMTVPDILLSGDTSQISQWRKQQEKTSTSNCER